MVGLVEVYFCPLLNDYSGLKGGGVHESCAGVYLRGLKSPRLKQALDSWEASRDVPSLDIFQPQSFGAMGVGVMRPSTELERKGWDALSPYYLERGR